MMPGDMESSPDASWFRDAIVYHIFVDRFAGYDPALDPRRPVFLGGNIRGITDKIPYIKDLGINTLWISPIFKTTAYHGYHITDFYSTDEHFGTDEDVKHLVEAAHRNNIRILLDFVPNHCSRKHPIFRKALEDKHSIYRKWFSFNSKNQYLCFLHYRELPKINLDSPEARSHIIGAARHWINMGFDGFRLDHAIGPSHNFWKAFRREVQSVNREAVLIGEAWLEGISPLMFKTIHIRRKLLRRYFKFNPWEIEREYIGEFDGVLDFFFRHRITEFIAWKEKPELYKEVLSRQMMHHYQRFPDNYYLPTFADNHDMNRFLFDTGQDRDKLKTALEFQFSLPQPPILYYGTETGLTHHNPVRMDVPFSDLNARLPMPWDSLDHELIAYCQELIRLRKRK
jgi:glycosidase